MVVRNIFCLSTISFDLFLHVLFSYQSKNFGMPCLHSHTFGSNNLSWEFGFEMFFISTLVDVFIVGWPVYLCVIVDYPSSLTIRILIFQYRSALMQLSGTWERRKLSKESRSVLLYHPFGYCSDLPVKIFSKEKLMINTLSHTNFKIY